MESSIELIALLAAGIFVIAALYSSVGHAGASGYIAIMSLLSVAPAMIKPTGLALNILVASIASWQFMRAGYFAWRTFWPFAMLAIPCAFFGGYVALPAQVFKAIVGIVLIISAAQLVLAAQLERPTRAPPIVLAAAAGAAIGLLSGLTGTGGGIFLTPLLLLAGWAKTKQAAAVSALFILCNSAAGLLGNFSSTKQLPPFLAGLLVAALLGGIIGSHLGSRRFEAITIKRILAVVLLIAGVKLILA